MDKTNGSTPPKSVLKDHFLILQTGKDPALGSGFLLGRVVTAITDTHYLVDLLNWDTLQPVGVRKVFGIGDLAHSELFHERAVFADAVDELLQSMHDEEPLPGEQIIVPGDQPIVKPS